MLPRGTPDSTVAMLKHGASGGSGGQIVSSGQVAEAGSTPLQRPIPPPQVSSCNIETPVTPIKHSLHFRVALSLPVTRGQQGTLNHLMRSCVLNQLLLAFHSACVSAGQLCRVQGDTVGGSSSHPGWLAAGCCVFDAGLLPEVWGRRPTHAPQPPGICKSHAWGHTRCPSRPRRLPERTQHRQELWPQHPAAGGWSFPCRQ